MSSSTLDIKLKTIDTTLKKAIVEHFFEAATADEPDERICRVCHTSCVSQKGKGHTNFLTHLKAASRGHPDDLEKFIDSWKDGSTPMTNCTFLLCSWNWTYLLSLLSLCPRHLLQQCIRTKNAALPGGPAGIEGLHKLIFPYAGFMMCTGFTLTLFFP